MKRYLSGWSEGMGALLCLRDQLYPCVCVFVRSRDALVAHIISREERTEPNVFDEELALSLQEQSRTH